MTDTMVRENAERYMASRVDRKVTLTGPERQFVEALMRLGATHMGVTAGTEKYDAECVLKSVTEKLGVDVLGMTTDVGTNAAHARDAVQKVLWGS